MDGTKTNGGENMNDGSLNATEIAVGSLLAGGRGGMGGGYGGGGGGAWGGGYGGGIGPFASPSSIMHAIKDGRQSTEDHADGHKDLLAAGIDGMTGSFENAERQRQFGDLKDGQFRGELRTSDKLGALQAEMNENARRAAECCCDVQKELLRMQLETQKSDCETQKLVVSENAATRELINQNTIRAAVDQNNIAATVGGINVAAAQNTAAIIQAIQGINGNGHH